MSLLNLVFKCHAVVNTSLKNVDVKSPNLMAQIMEFLLNLLLLRKNFLVTETFYESFRKCLEFKRKISREYKAATGIISPFGDMLDFVNHNSRQYRGEGENYVVTSETYYDLRKENRETAERSPKKTDHPAAARADGNTEKSHSARSHREQKNGQRKVPKEDHIIDNLNAILRSQEFLFKNIIKLVNILEKDEVFTPRNTQLEKLKTKLASCTSILTNNPSQKLSIINDIIEEELARCRFRHGESKTSAEISLKARKPEGIEVVLDSRYTKKNPVKLNLKLEDKCDRMQIRAKGPNGKTTKILEGHGTDLTPTPDARTSFKRSKSESEVSSHVHRPRSPESVHMDLADSRKLLEINEQQFLRCENTLWHTLTTTKFLSLKDEHVNTCKCAFYNKKQFIRTEAAIARKVSQGRDIEQMEQLLDVSDSVFRTMERKLLFEQVKQELQNSGQLTAVDEITIMKDVGELVSSLEKNPFVKLKEDFPDSRLKQPTPRPVNNTAKEETANAQTNKVAVEKESSRKVIEKIFTEEGKRQSEDPSVGKKVASVATETDDERQHLRRNQETNTIISSFKMTKPDEESRNVDVKDESQKQVVKFENDRSVTENASKCTRKGNLCIKGDIPEQKMEIDYLIDQKITTTVVLEVKNQNVENFIDVKNEKAEKSSLEKEISGNLKNLEATTEPNKIDKEDTRILDVIKEEEPKKFTHEKNCNIKQKDLYAKVKKHSENTLSKQNQRMKKNIQPSTTNSTDRATKANTNKADDKSALVKVVEQLKNSKVPKQVDLSPPATSSDKIGFPLESEERSTNQLKPNLEERINKDSTSLKINEEKTPSPLESVSRTRPNRIECDLKKEAEVIEMNKKVFEELETTIKNVNIFIEKTPRSKPTGTSSKQKFDDSSKKNMSTRRTGQQTKETAKKSLSNEKSRTFLKKKFHKNLFTRNSEAIKPKHSLTHSQSTTVEERDKSDSHMLRTTKNAMKRLQVSTIFPKVARLSEKKKAKISPVETEETKAAKMNQDRATNGNGEPRSETNFGSKEENILSNSKKKVKSPSKRARGVQSK